MPAQITHSVFGKRAMMAADIPVSNAAWFNLGCQGPDIFLHNQRTRPFSLALGRLLHRSGYGSFTGWMLQKMRSEQTAWNSPIGSYILGFISHAYLDRAAHPFIVYYAGWDQDYRYCHQFMERLIDIAYSEYCGEPRPGSYSYHETIDLGETIPEAILAYLHYAFTCFLPTERQPDRLIERISNAYLDTMNFLKITDRWDHDIVSRTKAYEKKSGDRRRLSLFHPPVIPDSLDILNLARKSWRHPWIPEFSAADSFIDIMERTTERLAAVLRALQQLTASQGLNEHQFTDKISVLIGNEDLNSGLEYRRGLHPEICDPLPLTSFLDSLYQQR